MGKYKELSEVEILKQEQRGDSLYLEVAVWEDRKSKNKDSVHREDNVKIKDGQYSDGVNSFLVDYKTAASRIKEHKTRGIIHWRRLTDGLLIPFGQAIELDTDEWERESFNRDIESELTECVDRWKQRAISKDYLTTKPDRRGTTLNLQVGAGNDDAMQRGDSAGFLPAFGSVRYFADATVSGTNWWAGGTRFTGATVPAGATIDSAAFLINPISTGEDCFANFYCENVDAAANYTTTANVIFRTRTTANTSIAEEDIATPWYEIDIASAVQEVTNRTGFASVINVIGVGKNNTALYYIASGWSYDGDTAKAAKLDIDYTAGGGGGFKPYWIPKQSQITGA